MQALLENQQNDRVRTLVEQIVRSGSETTSLVARAIARNASSAPHLSWLVPIATEQLSQPELKPDQTRHLCLLLRRINTDDALQELRRIAAGDDSIQRWVDDMESERREQAEQRAARIQQARDLIAGRLHPDDLVSTESYVWQDHGYVKAP